MDNFLADDPSFVAELEKLDLGPEEAGPGEFGHRRTLAEWAAEEGLVLTPPDDSPELIEGPTRALAPIGAAAFFGLMAVGAVTAALVFHDRVTLILATL